MVSYGLTRIACLEVALQDFLVLVSCTSTENVSVTLSVKGAFSLRWLAHARTVDIYQS